MSLVAALLIAGPLAAQEPDAPAAAAPEQAPQAAEVERAAAAEPAPAAGAEAVPAEPQPPEDPAGQLLARFSFDAGMTPDGAESGPGLAAAFRRASPVAHDGAALAIDAPRFTDGRAGKGLLLESAGANLFSPAQAGADDLSQFQALNGASLSLVSDQAWEGERCLSISVPGEAEGEGVSVEAPADKALYDGRSAVAAHYVASVYLKGQGSLMLTLQDAAGGEPGEAAYLDLSDEWQRVCCVYAFAFPSCALGAGREADWKTKLPTNSPALGARLRLVIATSGSGAAVFQADGFQLEAHPMPYPRGSGPAPRRWIPGGASRAGETLRLDLASDFFRRWREAGSLSFWFRPNWDARDGTRETVFEVCTNLMVLQHVGGKLHLARAGAAFTPSEWQGVWRHIAVTWDADGQWVLYLDGLDYPNEALLQQPLKAATAVVFGGADGVTSANGVLDDLMLFACPLTADQVRDLAGGRLLPPAGAPAP